MRRLYLGVITRRALPEIQAAHAEQHFQRKREERRRQDAEQPPLRRDQRLDRERLGRVAGERRARAVVRDRRAAGEPEHVDRPLERPAYAGRHRAQDDVDPDVLATPQQPRRGQHGDEVEHGFGDLVAPRQPDHARNDAHIAQKHVRADHQGQREDERAGEERERFERLAIRRLERCDAHRPNTLLRCGPYCGLDLMTPAQPTSFACCTYLRLVSASKLMVWMPACAWRLASFWVYDFPNSFCPSEASAWRARKSRAACGSDFPRSRCTTNGTPAV